MVPFSQVRPLCLNQPSPDNLLLATESIPHRYPSKTRLTSAEICLSIGPENVIGQFLNQWWIRTFFDSIKLSRFNEKDIFGWTTILCLQAEGRIKPWITHSSIVRSLFLFKCLQVEPYLGAVSLFSNR